MKSLTRDKAEELWNSFWEEMSQEWFKVEVLQDYTGEDDGASLRAWYGGDTKRSLELLKTDDDPVFTTQCKDKLAQGVKLLRIHVVEEPLSLYVQWEIEYYRLISLPLRGEHVFIVQRNELSKIQLPAGDFMLFDNERLVVNSYAPNGRMVHRDFYDRLDDISQFIQVKNELKKYAKSLSEFVG